MAISKVVYKSPASAQEEIWIDATPATAAAADIISPKTAMLANGVVTLGTGSGGITPTGNINITQAGQTDVTNYATATVPYADANGSVGGNFVTVSNELKYRISGEAYAESGGWVDGDSVVGTIAIKELSAIPRNTTITPTTSAQTIGDRETVLEGPITIAAVPSGTAGTPIATKGTVTNHSVTITPSVTNNTGYITGSTKTGTAVTVTAAELVSGSQTVTQNSTVDCTNLAQIVVNVSGGTSKPNIEDPVKFWDYDGTLLYSYTDAQALALTELPANPSHTGLVAEGWNWTLPEIKSYATDYPDGDINVGQTYITASGDTEIYVTLDSTTLHPYLKLAVNGTVEVDWGDNSTPSTMTGSSDSTLVWADHQYAAVGDYKISISVQSGRFTFISGNNTSSGGLFSNTDSVNRNLCYSSTVTKILLGSNVRCDNFAFQYLINLNTISISKTVLYLSTALFKYDYLLKHVTFPTLASLYSISTDCYQCHNLKSVSIPKNISLNGWSYTFYLCNNLLSVTTPDNQTTFDSNFISSCPSITKIVIPNSVTSINSNFYGLFNLKKIITNKTTINTGSSGFFSNCYSLESIPFSITCTMNSTSKLSNAFYNCYNLKSIPTWTRSVGNTTQFGNYVYGNCYKIRTAYIPSTITDLGSYAFQSCYCLESVTLPSNLELMGTSCFQDCWSLASITIPNTVTSIGNQCFFCCYSLSSITLSDTLTTLGNQCFSTCIGLTTLTIPATVTSIGNTCFGSMSSMQEFHFLRTSPPTSGTTPFNGIPSGCKIYVPYSADHSILNAYKSATNWSLYADYMEEEPQA